MKNLKTTLNLHIYRFVFLSFTIFIVALTASAQFTANPNLRQQLKSGTYNKTLIVPKGVLVVCRNATVKFTTGNGIIVKEGGTLYLDNCTITHANDNFANPSTVNKCGEYWNGIFVEGNPNFTQSVQYNKACNLLEACVNLYNGGTDSAYGMNDCWNANVNSHIQGLVYAKNTKIRQAIIGINLGDVTNDISHQVDPKGTKGGGLLIAIDCKFSNCHNSAISFAQYTKFLNLSRIERDTFECASKVPYEWGGFRSMRGLISSFNTYNYPIINNSFIRSNTSIWSFDQGIELYNGFASVYNNKFQNLTQGIFINSINVSLVKAIEIFGNNATDCNNLVEVWHSDLSSIYNNRITVKDVGNLGLSWRFAASILFNCKDATLRNNQFRPSNLSTTMNSIGISIGARSFNPPRTPITSTCFGNSVTGLSNALAHDQDARGNIIDCNTLKSNITFTTSVFDIGHTNYLFNFPTSYGSWKNPLSNTFAAVSPPSNFKNLWSSSLSYTYWWNGTSNNYRPNSWSTVLTRSTGTFKANPCNTDYFEKLTVKEPCGAIKSPLIIKNNIPFALFGRKNLDSSGNTPWDYYLAKSKYMQIFQKNFQALAADYSDSLKILCILKIDTLLETIPDSADYYYYSAFHYLMHQDGGRWTSLKSNINGLLPYHSELNYLTDYVEIVKTLTDSNFSISYVSSIQTTLQTIKDSDGWVSGKANSLYCYLYGSSCLSPMTNYGDTNSLQAGDSITYTYSPNPFDNSLTLTISNHYYTTKSVSASITSFSSGSVSYSNTFNILPGNTATINISTLSWGSDYYALLLTYSSFYHSEILYKP